MDLKTIEKFLGNAENLYVIILFTLISISIYVSVIGISTINMVTDIKQSESSETNNVKLIMEQINIINWYILYTILGLIGLIAVIIIATNVDITKKTVNGSKIISDGRNMMNIFILLLIVCVIIGVMILICNRIKNIADKNSTDFEINATANDELTVQGMYMSVFGITASVILIIAIYLFFVKKINLINQFNNKSI